LAAESALIEYGLEWWHKCSGSQVQWAARDVPLAGREGLHLHTIEYSSGVPYDASAPPLVLMHGFGFGAASYYAAAPELATRWPGRILCIDTLGCANSSRPAWPYPHGHRCELALAEALFVDAIEAWREEMGLESMALVAHSVGAYLAIAYAERHPTRCARLILASPVGVPHPPAGLDQLQADAPLAFRLVLALWRRGWSPFFLMKDLGRGRKLLHGYVTRRFADESAWIAKPELIEYFVAVWTGGPKSAGGYLHSTLLTPGGVPEGSQGEFVYARSPTGDRIAALALTLPPRRVSCIYGEFDWMYFRNAADVREKAADPTSIDVYRVAQATHQQMVDNPRGFVDAVISAADPTSRGRLPVGAGFGANHGALAKVWQRAKKLPQDDDPITVWASEADGPARA